MLISPGYKKPCRNGGNELVVEPTLIEPVTETFPGNVVVWLDLPIVTAAAVDVPIEIVLELSITTAPSPEMLVPLNVSAANAGPAVTARIPTKMPTKRGHPLRLSRDEFIFGVGYGLGTTFLNHKVCRRNSNPQEFPAGYYAFTVRAAWPERPVTTLRGQLPHFLVETSSQPSSGNAARLKVLLTSFRAWWPAAVSGAAGSPVGYGRGAIAPAALHFGERVIARSSRNASGAVITEKAGQPAVRRPPCAHQLSAISQQGRAFRPVQ
jgi:hypothetical protein